MIENVLHSENLEGQRDKEYGVWWITSLDDIEAVPQENPTSV